MLTTDILQKSLLLQKTKLSPSFKLFDKDNKYKINFNARIPTEPTILERESESIDLAIKGVHQGPELPPIQMASPQAIKPLFIKKRESPGKVIRKDLGGDVFNDYIASISPKGYDAESFTKRSTGTSIHSLKNKTDKRKKTLTLAPIEKASSPGLRLSSATKRAARTNESIEDDYNVSDARKLAGNFNLFDRNSEREDQTIRLGAKASPEKKNSEKADREEKVERKTKSPRKETEKVLPAYQNLYNMISEANKERDIESEESKKRSVKSPILSSLKAKLKDYQAENIQTAENQASKRANTVDIEAGNLSKVDLSVRTKFKNVSNSAKFVLTPVLKPLVKVRNASVKALHPLKRKIMKKATPEIHITEIYRARKEEIDRTLRLHKPVVAQSYVALRKNSKNSSVEERMEELVTWTSKKVLESRRPWRKLAPDPFAIQDVPSLLSTSNVFMNAHKSGEEEPKKVISKCLSSFNGRFGESLNKDLPSHRNENSSQKDTVSRPLNSSDESEKSFTRLLASRDFNREIPRRDSDDEIDERFVQRKNEWEAPPKNILERKLKNECGRGDSVEGWLPDEDDSGIMS